MTEAEIKDLLFRLAEAQSKRDLIAMPFAAQIKALQDMQNSATAEADAEIKALEAEVKAAVAYHGASVRGERLQAVYSVRNSWDTKGLMGYAVSNPQVRAFHSVSTSVSIRRA